MRDRVQISLSDVHSKWIRNRIASGEFRSAKQVVEDLIQKAQNKEGMAHLEDELEQIIDGEAARPMTREDWKNIRAAGIRLLNESKKK